MNKVLTLLLAFLFLSLQHLSAQNKTITGVVRNAAGEPLSGATINGKGSTIATTSDAAGKFSISLPAQTRSLEVSYVGMSTMEVDVSGKTSVEISLKSGPANLDEVVVVGYGTQKRGEVTSAVASVKAEDFTQGFARDAAQLIQGKVAGISVATTSGNPNANTQISLRGANSINGSSTPLILIDGVPGGLNTVPPEDIESIDVLKDGSAAAIYGTRGTNGVILITTKKRRGGNRPATMNYTGYVSVQQIARKMEFLNADDYRRLISEGVRGFNQNINPNAPGYSNLSGTNDEFGATTDWFDEITRTPISHTHNLTLQGGNAQTSYTASLNYRTWQGIFLRSDNSQVVGRLDINHAMFDNKLKFNFNAINRSRKAFDLSYNNTYRQALIRNPTEPIKTPTGAWYERSVYMYDNPLRRIEETESENKGSEMRLNGSVTFTPLKDLNFKLLVSDVKNNGLTGYYETFNHRTSVDANRPGTASRSASLSRDQLLEFTTDYSRTMNDHRFSVLGGYSYQYSVDEGFSANNSNFTSDLFGWNRLESGDALAYLNTNAPYGSIGMNSDKEDWKLIGFFGRVNYSFKEKYMLMASMRHEGSSKFGKNHKWGQFPAISAGWRINREDFMKNVDFVNDLKLRVGYGITGTIPNSSYLSPDLYNLGGRMLYNGIFIQSIQPGSNPNPELRWEKKLEWNFGVDFSVLKNRISGSVDYYRRDTKDMLYQFSVPVPPYLFPTIWWNAGTMSNKGLEVLLNINPVKSKDFNWHTTLTFAANSNKLVSLTGPPGSSVLTFFTAGGTGEPIQESTHRNYIGEPIGSFFGYKTIDIAADSTWIIEGSDGKPKSLRNSTPSDKQILGNGVPKYIVGMNNTFTYRKWDLNINLRGALGYQIMNFQRMFYENPKINQYNMLKTAFDPVYGKTPIYADLAYVSYYMEQGDHVKLDNVSLGYTFNVKNSKLFKGARVYVAGLNLYTFTGYKGVDPEVNRVGLSPGLDERDKYPTTRTFTFGTNINF
ncbi:TonB-dependent receptor [Segetibacter sp. 3557_3]|uniref:SusC/RagA family TonB-linked outer membrane protein n=1 Tax=Segetibacter sp. 3557_3 TaxID=2547429 RepID=UPI001058BDBF|nr:TonB-dependent receptor [Segetibacter sp. 3557_3]TDH26594.1 TonB-dependent receptor [Segetibacter sp. 3557_3]